MASYHDNSLSASDAAANVVYGTNSAYASTDFLGMYPKFTDLVPDAVLSAYIAFANACLVQARYQDFWPIAMGWFISHFLTLYLQSDGNPASTAAQAAQQGLARGIQVSKSAGDVSVSYQALEGLDGWASWTLTTYGQQFASTAKVIGSGSMYIW
jgi:hypothetical protein